MNGRVFHNKCHKRLAFSLCGRFCLSTRPNKGCKKRELRRSIFSRGARARGPSLRFVDSRMRGSVRHFVSATRARADPSFTLRRRLAHAQIVEHSKFPRVGPRRQLVVRKTQARTTCVCARFRVSRVFVIVRACAPARVSKNLAIWKKAPSGSYVENARTLARTHVGKH